MNTKRMVSLAALCAVWTSLSFPSGVRPQAGPEQAALYVFDTSGKTLIPSKNIVLDNGKKIAETRREHYIVLQLAPGRHVVWLKYGPKSDKVQLEAVAGQSYYTAGGYHPIMPAALSTTTFGEISKKQAEQYLRQMKPMTAEGEK